MPCVSLTPYAAWTSRRAALATIVDDGRPSTVESTESGCVVSGSKAHPVTASAVDPGARPTDSKLPTGFRLRVILRQAGAELCVPYNALRPIAQTVCVPETRCSAVAKACPLCVVAAALASRVSTGRPLSVMTVLIAEVVSGSRAQPLTEAPVEVARERRHAQPTG